MVLVGLSPGLVLAQGARSEAGARAFQPEDVFQLEWAADPRISPDGRRVAYVRMAMDVMTDRAVGSLWLVSADGSDHRPLLDEPGRASSPRWSPDGGRLAYVASDDGRSQIFVRWMSSGQTARVTQVEHAPAALAWSPDGRWLAFTMLVPGDGPQVAQLPPRPEGAEWAEPARVIERVQYRSDGDGFLEEGFTHVFVVPADGGTPRQLTSGDFDHGGSLSWTPDGEAIVLSANRRADWQLSPLDSEIQRLRVADGSLETLTSRFGPDADPVVSPDGRRIAYLGFDDTYQGYRVTQLYVMNADGSEPRSLTASLDRSVADPLWAADGRSVYFSYDDRGDTRVARVDLQGRVTDVVDGAGGLSIGRPYAGSAFSVADDGTVAYTHTAADHPSDVAVARGGRADRVTRLNADVLQHRALAEVEEIWYESSHDGRPVQGWIAKPPGFDPDRRYPLVLEIHGGPFANYGVRFSAEVQLYAAAGFVVLYANPRGSTSYGEEFGNLIHHAYPGDDYFDLISGVDAVIEQGYVDPDRLFVTGGSGGGVLTAWIVGRTDRFRAAVVAKPVINWYSFVLTSDVPAFFYRYWFPAPPWEAAEHYLARSPISYVGNVSTPTMLLTGEEDLRTPISESEQFYTALRLREVPTAMVRIPGAYHGIAARPSNLIGKVANVLEWFGRWDDAPERPTT
ncbi:MAG: S9 family peptidase [Gemmatimonadota bacterium]